MRRGCRLLLLLALTAGCSTALSSIRDADIEKVQLGQTRAEVEKVVGSASRKEPLPNGGLKVTYRLRLGRGSSDSLRWDSANAAGVSAELLGSGDWGCLAIIPGAIVAGTFVVAEGIACGKEVARLCGGESYDYIVHYGADGRVDSKHLMRRQKDSPVEVSPVGPPSDADLRKRWRAAQRAR